MPGEEPTYETARPAVRSPAAMSAAAVPWPPWPSSAGAITTAFDGPPFMIAESTDTPLRVLMVLHLPWDRNLGASRVQLELAQEFQVRGHLVEKFSYTDAFTHWPRSQLHAVLRQPFASCAKQHVMSMANRPDVIDAQQGDVPYRKTDLGFGGLLVARSSGLYELYRQFQLYERRRWPSRIRGTLPGRALRRWQSWGEAARQRRSLECADLIIALNEDERAFIDYELGLGEKSVVIPNGLAHDRFGELEAASAPPDSRVSNPLVAFIGYWSARKGSQDWGSIIRAVRAQVPDARFLFLGTGRDEAAVLRDLALEGSDGVRVIPSFDSDELPTSIEGFPIAVLEKLAAGLPTVAYDVPGPPETLRAVDSSLLTPRGDAEAFAARLVALLRMPAPDYAALAERCRVQARRYSWRTLADRTLAVYCERLNEIRGK
jgi:glycosyltransferase involved in cell wall biosynthesis